MILFPNFGNELFLPTTSHLVQYMLYNPSTLNPSSLSGCYHPQLTVLYCTLSVVTLDGSLIGLDIINFLWTVLLLLLYFKLYNIVGNYIIIKIYSRPLLYSENQLINGLLSSGIICLFLYVNMINKY